MKNTLLALSSLVLLTSCAGVRVVDTQTASGATKPSNIYIRPFEVAATDFKGKHAGGRGERPIRQSLAGKEFAQALKLEMEKLAPAMVLEDDERASEGWVIDGSLDVVDAGDPVPRFFAGHFGAGKSQVVIHVRVTDLGGGYSYYDEKSISQLGRRGRVVYEFDLAGGSRATGRLGSITAPGLGYSAPFDYKNAAERVMIALSVDPHRLGVRDSPTIRF